MWYLLMTKAYKNVVYLLPKVLYEKLAKLQVLALCSKLSPYSGTSSFNRSQGRKVQSRHAGVGGMYHGERRV